MLKYALNHHILFTMTHPTIQQLFDRPISQKIWVAPMAGVTDNPYRKLCKYFGAGHAVSEMMTADKTLRMSKKKFISC